MKDLALCALFAAWLALVVADHFEEVTVFDESFFNNGALSPAGRLELSRNEEGRKLGTTEPKSQRPMDYGEAVAIGHSIMERLAAHKSTHPVNFSPAQQQFLATIQSTIIARGQEKGPVHPHQLNSPMTSATLGTLNDEQGTHSEYVPYSGGYRMIKKVEPDSSSRHWDHFGDVTPSEFRASNFESDHVELLPDGSQRRRWYSQSLQPRQEQSAVIPILGVEDYVVDPSAYLMAKPKSLRRSLRGESFMSKERRGRRRQRNSVNGQVLRTESLISPNQSDERARSNQQPLWITLARARKNWEVRFKPGSQGLQPYLTVREFRAPGSEPIVREGFLGNNTFRVVANVQGTSPPLQADVQNGQLTTSSLNDNVRILNLTGIDTSNIPSLEQVPMEFLKNVLNITSLMANDEFKRKKFKCVITLETKMTICGYVLENNNP
uniref:TGF-beta propeptide domain-containing protein n=1 Tax=Trichuris muris TaxID=70415 RepID=A0A5S6QZD9_TRIMR